MNTRKILNDDAPAPQAPVQPDIDDCCRSGCVPCVFDLYEEAVERYRIELKAWELRRSFYLTRSHDKK
jgi:hypothetical protein